MRCFLSVNWLRSPQSVIFHCSVPTLPSRLCAHPSKKRLRNSPKYQMTRMLEALSLPY